MKQLRKNQEKLVWKKYLISFILIVFLWLGSSWIYREIHLSLWDGQSLFAWVDQMDEFKVNLVIPDQKRWLIFILPNETVVEAGFGFGKYRLNKIYSLGKLENQGGKLLMRTVQNYLGIGMDGWRVGTSTNLSRWDSFRLTWFRFFSAKGRVKTIKTVTEEIIHQEIFDEKLAAESLSVAVLNASGVDGIAGEVSRSIMNLGIEVSLIGNLDVPEKTSAIWFSKHELLNQRTMVNLKRLLKIDFTKEVDINEYRSDIVVVIGQDYTTL